MSGIRVYDANWSLLPPATGFRVDSDWVGLAAPIVGPILIDGSTSEHGPGIISISLHGNGTFHVLMFASGDVATTSMSIQSADPGAAASLQSSHDGAIFSNGADVPASLGAAVAAPSFTEARIDVGRVYAFHVARGFVGVIAPDTPDTGLHNATLSYPGGTKQCPCRLDQWPGTGGAPAGDYVVSVDGASLGTHSTGVLVAGVDVADS